MGCLVTTASEGRILWVIVRVSSGRVIHIVWYDYDKVKKLGKCSFLRIFLHFIFSTFIKFGNSFYVNCLLFCCCLFCYFLFFPCEMNCFEVHHFQLFVFVFLVCVCMCFSASVSVYLCVYVWSLIFGCFFNKLLIQNFSISIRCSLWDVKRFELFFLRFFVFSFLYFFFLLLFRSVPLI